MTLRRPVRSGVLRTRALASVCLTALAGGMSTDALARPYKTAFPEVGAVVQSNGAGLRSFVAPAPIALERFRLDYAKSADTSIRDLGVEIVNTGVVRSWMSDDSARAPHVLRATWRDLSASPSIQRVHLSQRCVASPCRLGSVAVRSDKVPLLTGFVFHNLAGAKNIERVSIFPERRARSSGGSTYFANFATDGGRAYTVDVDLILVDPSVVAGQFNASARSEAGTGFAKVPLEWKNGLLALQGFDVRFLNGAHGLQEFAIVPVTGDNSVKAVHFNDKNDDDPIEAKLWWADLRGPGVKVIPMDKPLPRQQPNNPGPKPTVRPGVVPSKKPAPRNLPTTPRKKLPGPAPTRKF